jgi:acid phosphatase
MRSTLTKAMAAGFCLAAGIQAASLQDVRHIVVIYQENWSFDGLLGKFPGASNLDSASSESTTQVDSAGVAYVKLPMTDTKHFGSFLPDNGPWDMTTKMDPDSLTADLVHRFYHNQYQINGGKSNRYVAGSDAKGLSMSYVDASSLPLGVLGKSGVVCDHFFQSAFGGSFLNHQWLVAAASPKWLANVPQSKITRFDISGNRLNDGFLTPDSLAINTVQPFTYPYSAGTADSVRLPPAEGITIADRLDSAAVSWKWYAGGWDSAMAGKGGSASINFQYHHQPFAYFKKFSDTASAYRKGHLQDETRFFADVAAGQLPAVSWIKPMGAQNEHPGYATLVKGMNHVKAIVDSLKAHKGIWDSTVVIITYDEFGGRFDHVAPPVIDRFGPGTRIPAVIVSPFAKVGIVDKTSYETVSTLAFIERRFGLAPLTDRDAKADPLSNAFVFSVPASVPGHPGKLRNRRLNLHSEAGQLKLDLETPRTGAVQVEAFASNGRSVAQASFDGNATGRQLVSLDVSGAKGHLVMVRVRDGLGERSQIAMVK